MSQVFAPTAIRASEAARCYRQATLRALGHEPAEHTPETLEYFQRGKLFEEYVVRQIEAKHGKENVRRQVEIDWGFDEPGHADALIVPERILVEVGSTTSPASAWDYKLAQLRLYLRFCPDADEGALYLINPSTLQPADVYRVALTDADIAAIDDGVASVRAALEGGPLPTRVCSKPGQARGRLCSFAEACFADWTPPEPHELSDPDVVDAAARLAAIKVAERPLKEQLAALDEGKKEAQVDLAELVAVGESVAGPWLVKRTHVQRQPTFSVKAFEAAGLSLEPLAEFFKPGAEYDTFVVSRAETAGELEFGDEAPF